MKKTKEELARKHYADIKQLIWSACVYPIRDYRGAIRSAGKLGEKATCAEKDAEILRLRQVVQRTPKAGAGGLSEENVGLDVTEKPATP